jgi:hypothetical protein
VCAYVVRVGRHLVISSRVNIVPSLVLLQLLVVTMIFFSSLLQPSIVRIIRIFFTDAEVTNAKLLYNGLLFIFPELSKQI